MSPLIERMGFEMNFGFHALCKTHISLVFGIALCLPAWPAAASDQLYYAENFPEHLIHNNNYTDSKIFLLPDGTIFKYSTCESYYDSCTVDRGSTGQFAEASLWNPAIRQWDSKKTSDFLSGAETVVTRDGRVILVGGETSLDTNVIIGKTATYDSKTQTFSTGPTLHDARSQHRATELLNGDILVTGGWVTDHHTTASVELLSGRSLKAVPPMSQSRSWHSATRLLSGNVLVVGGRKAEKNDTESQDLDSAELYDFGKNSWRIVSPMPTTRIFHSATLLADGRMMILGGATSEQIAGPGFSQNPVSNSVLFWDPKTELWSSGPEMQIAREGHVAILLSNGDVLVCGGLDAHYEHILDLSLWNHTTGTWTFAGRLTNSFSCWSMTLLANGDVFLGTDIHTDKMVVWSAKPESDAATTPGASGSPETRNLVDSKEYRWGTDIPENLTRDGGAFHFVIAPLQRPIDLKVRSAFSGQFDQLTLFSAFVDAAFVIAAIVLTWVFMRRGFPVGRKSGKRFPLC